MRTTYDVLDPSGTPVLNFDSKQAGLDWIKESYNKGFQGQNPKEWKVVARQSKDYVLGDKYRSDFDYEGMVKMGAKAKVSWGVDKLQKLFDSFEDVNYHTESSPLANALDELRTGRQKQAQLNMVAFNAICKETLKEM
jgi:hypothetical protein